MPKGATYGMFHSLGDWRTASIGGVGSRVEDYNRDESLGGFLLG